MKIEIAIFTRNISFTGPLIAHLSNTVISFTAVEIGDDGKGI